jgi:predicted nucleic-acid-binding Zn-ribbon protein
MVDVELADILRIHSPEYLAKHGDRMLPSHKNAMWDIENCRTEAFGGHVYYCNTCEDFHDSYHSCKNRHCPKCGNDNANDWVQKQNKLILPVNHFMTTFTLPEGLRPTARQNQKRIYDIMFRTSAAALQKLAWDKRFVGGLLGMVGVLQTWTRDMFYHPHIHYIVPGGGLSPDETEWKPSAKNFLIRVELISTIFRAKFRDELKKSDLFHEITPEVWEQDWVVNCIPVGSGKDAFAYLAPYIFRVAISNNNILELDHGMVTFQYKNSNTKKYVQCTIPAQEFIRRFLQHVLPHRFIKVRYYGLFSPNKRRSLQKAKQLLKVKPSQQEHDNETPDDQKNNAADDNDQEKTKTVRCPKCGNKMMHIKELKPTKTKPYFGKSKPNWSTLGRSP